jgi:hypothetical protein
MRLHQKNDVVDFGSAKRAQERRLHQNDVDDLFGSAMRGLENDQNI